MTHCGACTPSPRKLRPDSANTALATPSTALTIMGVRLLGNKCLKYQAGITGA
jgi:hypothetical protein